MKRIPLHIQIVIGLVLGIIWALFSSYNQLSAFTLDWIAPFGTIFINLLKLIAVPLVLFSIIKGIGGLSDVSRLGRLGIKTLMLYLASTVAAVGVGLLLVNTIKPGATVDEAQRLANRAEYEQYVASKEGVELIDGKNTAVVDAGAVDAESDTRKQQTEMMSKQLEEAKNQQQGGPLQFLVDMVPSNIFVSLNDNGLMLQVIFFAIFFGITMLMLPKEKISGIEAFVDGANEIFMKMVDIVMRGAPVFVFALLAGKISEIAGDNPDNVIEIFKGLAAYSGVVVAGLFTLIMLYPAIIALFTKKSFGGFVKAISPAQLLAFTTSSSVATLPLTMECVNDRIGVNKEITSFVLPIGATVNMDGTSLYQAVAVVFLAQFHMVDLTISQQLIIVLTATLASIGSAAVPSAGLVMMILVLESVGLDPAWVAIVFPVDRILDMCRTVVNVTGDSTVATLVASSEKQLHKGTVA